MSSDISAKPTFRKAASAVAAIALSIALGAWNGSIARAQSDGAAPDTATAPAQAAQPDQNGAADDAANQKNQAIQEAHDAADAAEQELDSATEARDQLESDGASQEEIDAANRAVAKARFDKDNADAAVKAADDAAANQ